MRLSMSPTSQQNSDHLGVPGCVRGRAELRVGLLGGVVAILVHLARALLEGYTECRRWRDDSDLACPGAVTLASPRAVASPMRAATLRGEMGFFYPFLR